MKKFIQWVEKHFTMIIGFGLIVIAIYYLLSRTTIDDAAFAIIMGAGLGAVGLHSAIDNGRGPVL